MNKRLGVGFGAIALVAVLVGGAWATGLIFGGPSQSAWAATVCEAAATDPLDEASWGVLSDRFSDAILLLEEAELPDGTEEFHGSVITGLQRVRTQLNGFERADPEGDLGTFLDDLQQIADSQPRGTSTDGAVSVFYSAIRSSEALMRDASSSLPTKSRAAIEDVPGCAERLLG